MFSEGKAFGSGELKEMKSGARREVEQGFSAFVHNFYIGLWRAAFGEILALERRSPYK
jgi:hypothetical protein